MRRHSHISNKGGSCPFYPSTYLIISIIHADLRPTSIIFVFIQSVRRRSLSFGERPLTSGPSLSTKSHAGMITYNFHPPFRNILNSIKFLLIQSRINVVAFGLLAPRPCLISILLWHQRKLPYWYTKVWNSHQLIPNLAYSPQGRLLRKRQDSILTRDYSSHIHPWDTTFVA